MSLILVDLLKADYGNKLGDNEGKILSITGLGTTDALRNKIPNVIDLFKKTIYYAKIKDIESKKFYTWWKEKN